ncbi:lipopolysaccharide assembly protein LapB [Ideonella sp. A 288]|uniref:tetratricopeptide repeat protein n=1 Tax=Ideonella sp. A 288 TaxID=1962181 RepID=UPI000B4AF21F|nr:tetratricopeptide repeat protein [Ideonella sp. A 288]
MTLFSFLRALTAGLLALSLGAAQAADTPVPAPHGTDRLSPVRGFIAQRNWPAAIDELTRQNDTGNADWNNLMGFSLRKAAKPDLAAAERFYDAALRIDPRHAGALEYSGELYLMTGRLDRAEKRLAELDDACFLQCPEYVDLKKAIDRYKANGNRYVPTP